MSWRDRARPVDGSWRDRARPADQPVTTGSWRDRARPLEEPEKEPTLLDEVEAAQETLAEAGVNRLRALPGKVADIARQEAVETPLLRRVMTALPLGGALANAAEEASVLAARQGWTTAPYEAITGQPFLSQEQINALPPDDARRIARRQDYTLPNTAAEAIDITTGLMAAAGQVVDAAGTGNVGRLADLGAEMGAGMVEDLTRTAGRGGFRREAPVSSVLDVADVGGAAAAVSRARGARGVGGRVRAFREGAREARGAFVDDVAEAMRGDRAVGPLVDGWANTTPGMREVTLEQRLAKDGAVARADDQARMFDRAFRGATPEQRQAAFDTMTAAEPLTPARYEALGLQDELRALERRVAADPNILLQDRYAPIRQALDEGVTWDDMATSPEALQVLAETAFSPRYADEWTRSREAEAQFEQAVMERGRAEARAAKAQRRLERANEDLEGRSQAQAGARERAAAGLRREADAAGDRVSAARQRLEVEQQRLVEARRVASERGRAFTPGRPTREGQAAIRRAAAQVAKANPLRSDKGIDALWRNSVTDADTVNFRRAQDALRRGQPPSPEQVKAWRSMLEPVNKLARRKEGRHWNPEAAFRAAMRAAPKDPVGAVQHLGRVEDAFRQVPGFENFRLDVTDFADWTVAARELEELHNAGGAAAAARRYVEGVEERLADNPFGVDLPPGRPENIARNLVRQGDRALGGQEVRVGQARDVEKAQAQTLKGLRRRVDAGEVPATRAQIVSARSVGKQSGRLEAIRRDLAASERALERATRRAQKAAGKMTRPEIPRIQDVLQQSAIREMEVQALARGGALLKLGDDVLNTTEATLRGLGRTEDLLEAARTGRLRFEAGPGLDPSTARFLNDAGVPQIIAGIAEQAKQLHELGRIGDDAFRANLTSYITAAYNETVLRHQKMLRAKERVEADAVRALDQPNPEEWLSRRIDEARNEAQVGGGFDGGSPGILGPVDRTGARRASAKYIQDIEQQLFMGRLGADELPGIIARTMGGQQMLIHEARLLRNAAALAKQSTEIAAQKTINFRTRIGSGDKLENVPYAIVDGEEWVQVPMQAISNVSVNGKPVMRWGDLAGRWVRTQDFRKLEGAMRMQNKLLRRVSNTWKLFRVPGRLGAHMLQFVENVTKSTLLGGPGAPKRMAQDAAALHRFFKSPDAPGADIHRAFRDGGGYAGSQLTEEFAKLAMGMPHGVDFIRVVSDEMRRLAGLSVKRAPGVREWLGRQRRTLAAVRNDQARAVLRHNAAELGVALYEAAADLLVAKVGLKRLWEAQDLMLRHHGFMESLRNEARNLAARSGRPWSEHFDELAKDPQAIRRGIDTSRRWGFDYADLPEWAEVARSIPFVGMPFVAWPVKATGFYTRMAIERPRTFRGFQEASEAQTNLATEYEREVLKNAPPWARRRAVLAPFSDGRIVNTRYLSPITFFPLTEQGGQGNSEQAAQGVLAGLGGAGLSIFEVMQNNSVFLQRPIYNEDDTRVGASLKVMRYILAQEGPGWLSDILFKVVPAHRGDTDGFRGRRLEPLDAWAHFFGIKAEPVDVPKSQAMAYRKYEERLRDAARWWRKLTPEEQDRPDKQAEYKDRVDRALREYEEKMAPYY